MGFSHDYLSMYFQAFQTRLPLNTPMIIFFLLPIPDGEEWLQKINCNQNYKLSSYLTENYESCGCIDKNIGAKVYM